MKGRIMYQELQALISAADVMRAALNKVSCDADEEACAAFIAAADGLEAATDVARHATAMPNVMPFWERRVSIEAMYWPAVYFDAPHDGEALDELVDELWEHGTAGLAKTYTDTLADAIKNNAWDGIIARVSIPAPEMTNTQYVGVITATSFEGLAAAALAWSRAITQKQFKRAA